MSSIFIHLASVCVTRNTFYLVKSELLRNYILEITMVLFLRVRKWNGMLFSEFQNEKKRTTFWNGYFLFLFWFDSSLCFVFNIFVWFNNIWDITMNLNSVVTFFRIWYCFTLCFNPSKRKLLWKYRTRFINISEFIKEFSAITRQIFALIVFFFFSLRLHHKFQWLSDWISQTIEIFFLTIKNCLKLLN